MLTKDDIVEMHLLTNEWGYPVFALGFEPHLKRLQDFLERIPNLRSTGRQGAFTYPNMHNAMRMGATAAREVMESVEVRKSEAQRVES
jgi:protoporphyrinogen oxidase